MTNALATTGAMMDVATMDQVLIGGDLSGLNPQQRLMYYKALCDSVGLNPLTKPFDYLQLDGKLVLYAKKDCTDQLRTIKGISVKMVDKQNIDNVYIATARATDPNGREDEDVGAVSLVKEGGIWKTNQGGKRFFESDGTCQPLTAEARANAMMKAHTKAKRRVTLSICGLGMLDESEVSSIPGARVLSPDEVYVETYGETPGTKEAQAAVAAAKIADATAKVPKQDSPRMTFNETVAAFTGLKQAILNAGATEGDYYRIIGKQGMQHGNDLKGKTAAQIRAALAELTEFVAKVTAEPPKCRDKPERGPLAPATFRR